MEVVLVGTSHHLAPIEVRERMSFEPTGGAAVAAELAGVDGEAVALSTCNRSCLYMAHRDLEQARARAQAQLAEFSGLTAAELAEVCYAKTGEDAVRHLFRVTAGLDSMIPGETQILGQVRQAYEVADQAGAVGPLLHRLFAQALHVGRRVRAETRFGENPGSVSEAAAELAASVFGDLNDRRILVLGAGKMAELAVANLVDRGVELLTVANRSVDRAHELAARFGGRGVGLDVLETELVNADVVIASTGAAELVLSAAQVEETMRGRRGEPIFFIDIAVPRDLDPSINELADCYLYDIDDLETVVSESLAGHREESARAESIVEEETGSFMAWQASLDVVPAIASLRAMAEDIRATELERAEGRLGSLSDRERRAVESLTAQIVNKLLHLPTVRMKQAAAGADGVVYAEAVRHLFGLPEERE